MSLVPILIDSKPEYLAREEGAQSLLTLPVGTGTLLQAARGWLDDIGHELTVIPTFPTDAEYDETLRRLYDGTLRILAPERFGRHVAGIEPSDWLLLVDVRHHPRAGISIETVRRMARDAGWSSHAVTLDGSVSEAAECVQLDGEGHIRRIQRFYSGRTWVQSAGVVFSVLPAAALKLSGEPAFASLGRLRQLLAARSVPSRDEPIEGGAIDLARQRGALELMELTVELPRAAAWRGGHREIAPGVVAGPESSVDPTARLVGPLVIQRGARVEADATLLGPAIVGEGAVIGRGATVAQALLLRGGAVAAGDVVRHAVTRAGGGVNVEQEGESELSPTALMGRVVNRRPRRRAVYGALKRASDMLFAAVGVVLLSPLLLAVALLVRLTSRGPALFGHEREGLDGRVFRCWKFRTMVRDAHLMQRTLYRENTVDGPQFKLPDDPRVTRVGYWLRATNIDELPQLFNVLLGEMSLIGPRPSPFRENQICVPWRQARLSVRPGITGLWQICRSQRSSGDFHQWIFYDMLYVAHASFWLDLKILAATVLTLGGRWKVPYTWLISSRALYDEDRAAGAWRTSAPAERGQHAAVA